MPPVSDFYERKRRLAYVIAGVSLALLVVALYSGFALESYARPNAAADGDAVHVVHHTASFDNDSFDDDKPDSRLLVLDPSTLRIRERFSLLGEAAAVLVRNDEVTAFFGRRYAVLRRGEEARGADLSQKWDVQDAVADPARDQDWIFGWSEGRIVARKRRLGNYSEEIPVLESGPVDRLSASMDGASGPLLAWRERGSQVVKTALYDGQSFAPAGEFDIGAADYWDAALARGRVLLAFYLRGGLSRTLTLHLRCCRACDLPPPPATLRFADTVLIGRRVTGLSAAVVGDSLALILSRTSTLQGALVPLGTLTPAPGARLQPLGAEPLWRRLVGMSFPMVTLFFSFSLIFLGYTLLRERNRFVLEMVRPAASSGPVPAAILQRAMAHTLDWTILVPVVWITSELLNVVPESTVLEPFESKTIALYGVMFGIHAVYHAVLEAAFGWTVGKKIIGLRVAELDGSRVTLRGALLRNLVRPFDADNPFGAFLGVLAMMLTRRRQRPGDLLARTMVVEEAREGSDNRDRKAGKEVPRSGP
jgi:uncharacterized RDD family membrane protein YckC